MIEGLKQPEKSPAEEFVFSDDDMAFADLIPTEQFYVIKLRHVVGATYQQIADELQVPLGTVRSRIHRGRAAILKLRAAAAPVVS